MRPRRHSHSVTVVYAVLLAVQLGFLVALTVGGFLLLGYGADRWAHSMPVFTVLGILFGITLTALEIRHWLAPLLRISSSHD